VLDIAKYFDRNANGLRDPDETALPDFTFTIARDDGTVTRTVVTEASGTVTVRNLPLGSYTVTETAKEGWVNTDPGMPAVRTFTLTTTSLTASLLFGNAQVRLPSTSTDDDTPASPVLPAPAIGIALLACVGLLALETRRRT